MDRDTFLLAGAVAGVYFLSERGAGEPGDGSGEPPDDGENGDTSPETFFTSDGAFGTTPLDVTIRQSVNLTQRNGRVPEREDAKALVNAMELMGQDYNIWIGFDPVDPPSDSTGLDSGNLQWFKENMDAGNFGRVANDANMLLQDTQSGGLAYVGGKYGIVNAQEIIQERPWREAEHRSDGHHQAQYAFLHELGHMLCSSHRDPGNLSNAWVDEEGRFHKTPNYGGPTVNECGQELPPQQSPVVLHLRYSACAEQRMCIQ